MRPHGSPSSRRGTALARHAQIWYHCSTAIPLAAAPYQPHSPKLSRAATSPTRHTPWQTWQILAATSCRFCRPSCHFVATSCRSLPLLPAITRNVKLPIPANRLEFSIRKEGHSKRKYKSGKNGNVDRAGQLSLVGGAR